MIGLLPLYPAHGSALKGSNPSDLHEGVNPHFILARNRSCGFGSGPSDYTHFHTLRLVTCAHIAFASTSSLDELSLATEANSLPCYPKQTLQPWNQLLCYKSLTTCSLKNWPYRPQHTITVRFQVLLTSISGYFSALGHPTNSLSVSECI